MAPEVDVAVIDVEPVTVPADCDMAPDPFAASVTAVPARLPLNAIPPLLAVVLNPTVPVAVVAATFN